MYYEIKNKIRGGVTGLEPLPLDSRDYNFGALFGREYQPKHKIKEISLISIKNQGRKNTCSWNAAIMAKEPDEGMKLSVRAFVRKGYEMGLIRGDGFANLRSGQEVLRKWGAVPEAFADEMENVSWGNYIKISLINWDEEAAKHKTQTYWRINSLSEYFKVIDDGRPVVWGIDWYSGYNGLRGPYIVSPSGRYIGGHAVVGSGYDTNREVVITPTSFGERWGDKGRFYTPFHLFEQHIRKYGAFVNLDMLKDKAEIINKYANKNIKAPEKTAVYLIENGKKRVYTSWEDFVKYNHGDIEIKEVPQDEINLIPDGENISLN